MNGGNDIGAEVVCNYNQAASIIGDIIGENRTE